MAEIALAGLGIDKRLDDPAEIERVDDEFQAFGQKHTLLVAELLQRQGSQILDDRVGQAGDFLDLAGPRDGAAVLAVVMSGHLAPQRLNRDVERARPEDRSRRISSPDCTSPPRPVKASRISS